MVNHTEIPEELEEMIKEIIAYEELNDEELEEINRWAQEWLYIEPPTFNIEPDKIDDVEEEDTWKIEINI